MLTVHGGDRPGIVSSIVARVAAVGGNITDLTTRLAGELYLLVAEVDLPHGVDPEELRTALRAAADELGVGRHPARGRGRRAVTAGHDRLAAWTEAELGVDGRVLEVVRAPERVLSTPGERVDPTAPETVQLAADLVATMRVSPGCVGLAAPQVGSACRCSASTSASTPRPAATTAPSCSATPRWSSPRRNEKAREGCMCVPDLTGDVKRASRVVVRGQLPGTGEEVEVEADAFEARALQHEIDHCAGLLFLDRVAGAHAVHQRKTYL